MSDDDQERKARKGRKAPVFFAGLAGFAFPIGLAVLFLALHLPYLPASLEDLDSINFALGVRAFDVAHHQPHPPGYPVFILLAKAVHAVVPAEAAALALVSVVAGALGVVALTALFRRLDGAATAGRWSVAAVAVAMTTPLYWFTAARPLSDTSGLAAALAVQAMTLAAATTRGLAAAAFCAGLAAGLRSQVVWLTVPLLILQGLRAKGLGLSSEGSGLRAQGSGLTRSSTSSALSPQPSALGDPPLALSPQPLALMLTLFVAGALLWFIPLVLVSGGPSAYWHALFDQGAEDLGNIRMLWSHHSARDLQDALYYAFVAPWAAWPVAAVALVCASTGLLVLARRRRPALAALAAAFGPYLVLDLLFQETFTSRYALPLIVPVAYLVVAGLRVVPWDIGLVAAAALAMFSAHIGGTSVAAYSRAKAPAFRLLDDMRAAAPSGPPPVLAMDRRQWFDLRRPIKWMGDAPPQSAVRNPQSAIRNPQFTSVLAAPPQHEWLEAVKYWNGGGRAPVWFVVDPMRAAIDLVQHGDPLRFRWPLPYPVLLSGARPNEMDWYRVDRPEWYVGEGWALTPEAAGVAEADHRGPSAAPIEGWVDRRAFGGTLMIGGRSLDPTARPTLSVLVEGRSVLADPETLMPGPFLRMVTLPFDLMPRTDQRPYARITVQATPGSGLAIEQFDASASRPLMGFGEGWHEQEFNPRTGARWRWLSERGELHLRSTAPRAILRLEGESPRTYFARGSRLIVRSGDRVVLDEVLSSDFSRDVPIAGPPGTIVFETDQTYVPAERSGRTQDRRRLGLRIFRCELRAIP